MFSHCKTRRTADDFVRDKKAKLAGQSLPPSTHNTPGLPALNKSESGYIERALEAMAVLRKTFEFWVAIGRGLKALHVKAEQLGGKQTYDRLRERESLGKEIITKTRSSPLLAIIDNLSAVEAWRADELDDKERFNWASPEAAHRHCPVFAKDKEPRPLNIERALNKIAEAMHDKTPTEKTQVAARFCEILDVEGPKNAAEQ